VSDESPMRNGDCNGNAAPYVLRALPDSEHDAFVAHLATCAVCREEVAALQMVAAALPAAVPQLRAPAQLKANVMREVGSDARRQRLLADGAPARGRARARAPHWRPVLAPLAVGLAVLALLVVVLASSGGGGARIVRAQVLAPGASGFVRVSGGQAELTLRGMPATTAGRVYEVWVKRVGAPSPTDALFTVTSAGAATVGVPGGVSGVHELLVTSEPLGGSPAPTRNPTVIAKLD
jgi:anti-sigma-K factor RskA